MSIETTNNRGAEVLRRYIHQGDGTAEEIRAYARSQLDTIERRISTSMQDATALKMNLVQQSRKQNIADNAAEVDSKLYDYELDLWQARMGKLVKMSCNIWEGERKVQSLTEAEDATLELYMQRADIRNDQDILDLGCGYGPVTFFLAQRLPKARFTALTMSFRQVQFIEQEARRLGIDNITAIRADINDQDFEAHAFDRIISIEVLEYFSNLGRLFLRASRWLKPGGLLFTQFSTSKLYCFKAEELAATYTGESFFYASDYLLYMTRGFQVKGQWWISGIHCARSLDAWTSLWQQNRDIIIQCLQRKMTPAEAEVGYRTVECYQITYSALYEHLDGQFMGMTHYIFEKDGLLED